MKITERIDHTNLMTEQVWLSETPPCPKSVKISLNDNCQFSCKFCINSVQHVKPVMAWDMFTRLVDELLANGTEEIGLFFIGEPLIDKRLKKAIGYVKSIKPDTYIFITTNGQMATAERVRPLMEAGLSSIKFSYNYADGQQLAEVAGVKPKVFDELVANIRAVRRMRDAHAYKCGIYASSIKFDGKQEERMRAAVDLILPSVDEHYYLPQYSFGAQTDFGEQVLGNPGRLANLREPLPCWTIFKEGHVTAGGAVSLCCFDVHDKWKAGDLHHQTFMQAWHSDAARALRKAHLAKDARGTACENCAHGTGAPERKNMVVKFTKTVSRAQTDQSSAQPAQVR